MKRIGFLFVLSVLTMLQIYGQQYDAKEFRQGENLLRYRVLYPEGYKTGDRKKYPLVIFLHGRGESGSDNELQLKHGSALFLKPEMREKYPAIVIFPQCANEDAWATYTRNEATGKFSIPANPKQTQASLMVQRLIKHYLENEQVDANRVYIMGLSMGAMGTLDLAVRNRKMFAAAISICGAIEPARLKKLKKMPIRFYHGVEDAVVPVDYSRSAYYELKAAGSTVAEIIEYQNVGHDSWDYAFASKDFLPWLFSFKK
jgi:predicted peptidase